MQDGVLKGTLGAAPGPRTDVKLDVVHPKRLQAQTGSKHLTPNSGVIQLPARVGKVDLFYAGVFGARPRSLWAFLVFVFCCFIGDFWKQEQTG